MQTVTFETAKALKEAGFPQPEPQSGQFWYDQYGNLSMLSIYNPAIGAPMATVIILDTPGTYEVTFDKVIRSFAYAPTATDLIPPGWYLYRENEDSGMEIWACASDSEVEHFHNDNPTEAAALAWLHVNRNFSNV